MAKSKIHVGLEIGSSKTCMVVGETKSDGSVTLLGIGEVKSAGVRKGEIVDLAQACQCVTDAWNLAQDHADADILSVYLSVTGAHIQGVSNRGTYRLPEGENVIAEDHMDEVNRIAQDIPLGSDSFVIHRSPGKYTVDGNDLITHPEGLSGHTLDVDFHIVHGIKSRIHNSLRCVREVPLEVEDVVFAPIATGLAVLDRQHREAGCLLIDIGGGTTDFCLYMDDQPIVSGCIPVGGDHITSDIHQLTNIPLTRAEILKITEGDASSSASRAVGIAKLPATEVMREVSIERAVLNDIIHQRVAETLQIVKSKLPAKAQQGLPGGVFLSGGTSLLRGIGELAGTIFRTSVFQLDRADVSGTPSYLEDPRFRTAIGIIRYAQLRDAEPQPDSSLMKKLFGWFK